MNYQLKPHPNAHIIFFLQYQLNLLLSYLWYYLIKKILPTTTVLFVVELVIFADVVLVALLLDASVTLVVGAVLFVEVVVFVAVALILSIVVLLMVVWVVLSVRFVVVFDALLLESLTTC